MNTLKTIGTHILYLLAGLSIVVGALVCLIGIAVGVKYAETLAPHFLHISGQVLLYGVWIVIGVALLFACYGLGLMVCGKLDE